MTSIKELDSCSEERWKKAQECELKSWLGSPKHHDDWNSWWLHYFKNYECLKDEKFNSYIEVGCGPYAKNTEFFLNIFPDIKDVSLLEPLLYNFVTADYHVKKISDQYNAKLINSSIEEHEPSRTYDIVLCINVLDHVKDANLCMQIMNKMLSKNGILILGQDLTNEEDLISDPSSLNDIGHPIKLDHLFFRDHLKKYRHIHQHILPREYGRNPKAHYGTLFYIGKKIS